MYNFACPLWALAFDALPPPAPMLPAFLAELNLIVAFRVYLTAAFLLSLAFRIRFYRSIYQVALHLSRACPSIADLISQHWLLCVREGIIIRVGAYLSVLLVYEALIWLVFPGCRVSLASTASRPGVVAALAALGGLMFGLDGFLIARVGTVDEKRIRADLTLAESWLGGQVNEWLDLLGKWNPIRHYADVKARETMAYLNAVFRSGLALMTVQTLLRATFGAMLFVAYVVTG